MTCGMSEPKAVHCPVCEAEPGKRCKSPSGKDQIDHAQRLHLAYALEHPEADFKRAEAERYRLKWPEVAAHVVVCAPSRSQALWWAKWGVDMEYDQAAYEREHGHPDTSVPALPEGQEEELMSASELLSKMTMKEPVKQRRKRQR